MSGDSNTQLYKFSLKGTDDRFDGQEPEITLQLSVKLECFDGIDSKFLTISLLNSTVAASLTGDMVYNTETHRGWYTEKVHVYIGVDGFGNNPLLEKDYPSTTSSETTFSTSETLGVTAGASVSGSGPSLSIGVSNSSTTSTSQTVADFTVANNSADDEVNHDYNLSSTPKGLYTGPKSLVIKPSSTDFLEYDTLSAVTNNDGTAISNLPLASQAVYRTPTGDFNQEVSLRVRVTHYLQSVSTSHSALTSTVNYYTEDSQPVYDLLEDLPVEFSAIRNPEV
ncbi:hypothetical protein [Endozoicomonas arenosclerae]|uniref:hypothetical protein n=1 Tax=Endozoicomonas arenosclerae TaxID=1633495 RepID=UPI000785A93B|nr:hypothetical protein [Endozoicomonas arenosclerae]